MRILIPLLTFVFLFVLTGFSFWSILAIAVWVAYVVQLFYKLNDSIAFREYILVMYGLNYLFAPALTYEVTQSIAIYKMRLTPELYFSMAIPAMVCLHIGLYTIKTKIFTYQFSMDNIQTTVSEKLLKRWLIAGVILDFISPFFSGDIAFIVYLLSSIKYVAAFALFCIDKKKYKWYLIPVLFLEVVSAFRVGMFHDMVVWILFFGMLWTYMNKPSAGLKFSLIIGAAFALFLLQTAKSSYREQLGRGQVGFESFSTAVSKNSGGEGLFKLSNIAYSLTRANQGWIFSSAVQRMDMIEDYQGLKLLNLYAEAAFLPRAFAPNKLEAGDTKIFNEFSGIRILKGTSMGLGLFADGYIAYGFLGTLAFAFCFGLLCSVVFKLVENWASITPYFALFAFPVLNFAVRADCETQTWMGHIVKGIVIYSVIMFFTKRYFRKKMAEAEDEPDNQEDAPAPLPQLAIDVA